VRALLLGGAALVGLAASCTVSSIWGSGLSSAEGEPDQKKWDDSSGEWVDSWVDFQAFVHVGKVEKLDEFLAYPNEDWLQGSIHGILVLYVMPSNEWKMMIDYVKELVTDESASPAEELQTVHDTCKEKMDAANSKGKGDFATYRRIRIVSPLDLEGILLSIRHRLGHEKFSEWFEQTTYDAPKLMDSIMRLRGMGNAVPVFRFDDNVLFNDYVKDNMSMLATAVAAGVDDYNRAVKDPFTQSFVLSQKYSGMMANRTKDFLAWNEAYSTRPNPALLATPAMVDPSQWSEDGGWGSFNPTLEMLQESADPSTLMLFYGVTEMEGEPMLQTAQPSTSEDEDVRLEKDILSMGNTYIGAPPTVATTSGAALCVGPGAALDMAPMIHTPLNIMWVDDYLLNQRAQEIFGTRQVPLPPNLGEARVIKARSLPNNPAKFTLELYMPTLFYGIIMDKWLLASPFGFLAKYPQHLATSSRHSDLAKKELEEADSTEGTLIKMEERVRNLGKLLSKAELANFTDELWSSAGERMADVWWQWSHLPEPKVNGTATKTFASLWATGTVAHWPGLQKYATVETYDKKALGMVKAEYTTKNANISSRAKLPPVTKKDMNPAMAEMMEVLINTSINQLDWTLEWPDVVQAVRDINVGLFVSDVQFGTEKEADKEFD
jgi:hypothetical protein